MVDEVVDVVAVDHAAAAEEDHVAVVAHLVGSTCQSSARTVSIVLIKKGQLNG